MNLRQGGSCAVSSLTPHCHPALAHGGKAFLQCLSKAISSLFLFLIMVHHVHEAEENKLQCSVSMVINHISTIAKNGRAGKRMEE